MYLHPFHKEFLFILIKGVNVYIYSPELNTDNNIEDIRFNKECTFKSATQK
jgi:hypothetical protein